MLGAEPVDHAPQRWTCQTVMRAKSSTLRSSNSS